MLNADLINGKIYPTLAVSAEKPPLRFFAKLCAGYSQIVSAKICKPKFPHVGEQAANSLCCVPYPTRLASSGYKRKAFSYEIFRRSASLNAE